MKTPSSLLPWGVSTSSSDDSLAEAEPNPPHWPDAVQIFHPHQTTEEIEAAVRPFQDNSIPYTDGSKSGFGSQRHFSEDRCAFLFAPGHYSVDLEVGYYVQVAGLGKRADQVVFQDLSPSQPKRGPYVPALNKTPQNPKGSSLDTFWRSAENFTTTVSKGQLWAVSQAAPLRRIHIKNDLYLSQDGFASGGVLCNAVVGGNMSLGTQQQWLSRSVTFQSTNRKWTEGKDLGAWSSVFVDCVHAPAPRAGSSTTSSVTVYDEPLITVEKPFVVLTGDASGRFELRIPTPRRRTPGEGPLGADLMGSTDVVRDFRQVHVARATLKDPDSGQDIPDGNVAQKINQALSQQKDVVLSPGVYYLKEPIELLYNNQVILGLGLATLVAPVNGKPCIKVASNLEGVRVAGIMLEASNIPKDRTFVASLLEWGDEGVFEVGNPENPGVLTDVFARVGGSNLDRLVGTDVMVRIHSSNVYGDNLWLWRADHVQLRPNEDPNFPPLDYHQVTRGECPVKTGLEVFGNDVTIHGLAVEHTTEHLVVWHGERGNVQFYQSELPYDVKPDFAFNMYTGYMVGPSVTNHTASGVGVYSNFRDYVVSVPTAIRHPVNQEGISFTNSFTVRLDNYGFIMSVINGEGEAAEDQGIPVRQ